MLIEAKIMKCKKEDAVAGKPWCIYRHPKNSDKVYSPQPKGWPRHFKTKDEAERGAKMINTFKGGWYVETMLPIVYSTYKENRDMFNSKKNVLLSIKDIKVRAFLDEYTTEMPVLKHWVKEFDKVKSCTSYLESIYSKLKGTKFNNESKIIASIYVQAEYKASLDILKKYYDERKIATAHPGIFIIPEEELETVENQNFDMSLDPNTPMPNPGERLNIGLEPGEGLGNGRMAYNRFGFMCPECKLKLLQQMHKCPFCGENPLDKMQMPINDPDALQQFESMREYLGY